MIEFLVFKLSYSSGTNVSLHATMAVGKAGAEWRERDSLLPHARRLWNGYAGNRITRK
jgi:hypothetical protein